MRLGDLFGSSDVPYPGGNSDPTSSGYQPPQRTGFFNQFFAPTDLPYPVPPLPTSGPIVPLTPAASNPTPPASNSAPAAPNSNGSSSSTASTPQPSPPTPTASPVTVIVQAAPCSSSTDTSASSAKGTAAAMPVGDCPTPPNEQIVTAYSANPRLRARAPRGQELVLEEMTGEPISLRMLSKDSAPVTFVVPDGCDAVEFTYGAIEANPGQGQAGDLDEVVTVGALKGIDPGQVLSAGDQLSIVVPWRHGSWVEMAANHLRLPIVARFYQIENA